MAFFPKNLKMWVKFTQLFKRPLNPRSRRVHSIRPYTSEYTAVYSGVHGRILEVYGERFLLNLTCCAHVACASAHGSIGQLAHICLAHVSAAIIVSSMFSNAHQKEKGLCLESIQDFSEGIKRRQLTPYAVCALHPQTSTPAPHFVSHVMAHPVFFTLGLRGKRATAKTFVDAIGSISIAW